MKYMAHVVPAVGKPLKRGDISSVVSAAVRLLEASPGYTISIRPSDTESKPRHSILLRRTDDGFTIEPRLGGTYTARPEEVSRDTSEITTVLTNLGCTVHP